MSAARHSPAPASAKSILRYLLGTGSALWLLVMALQPDVGFAAPLPWMGLFWLLKISTGLAVLQSVLYLLSRSQYWQTLPLWLLVAASGVAGAALRLVTTKAASPSSPTARPARKPRGFMAKVLS